MSFSIPNSLNAVQQVPLELPIYTPALDWVSITGAVINEVLFLASDATNGVYTIRTTFTRPGSENIYIDWGDGSPIDTISTITTVDTTHTYTSGGTACTRGYNTWKIRVYGDSGTRITTCRVIQNSTDFADYPSGLLQAWYGDNTVTTMQSYFNEADGAVTVPVMNYLEFVNIPNDLSGTALYETFNACRFLQKVTFPSSLSGLTTTALQSTFYNCSALYELNDFPSDLTNITSLENTFFTCQTLPKVTFTGPLTGVTTLSSTFRNCYSLGYLSLPALPSCTNYSFTFLNCYNIRFLSLPSIPNTTVTFSETFRNCSRLQKILLDPNTTATVSLANAFNGCASLKSLTFPNNLNITSLNQAFNACGAMVECILPNSLANNLSLNQTFGSCFALQSFTFPSTPPSGTYSMQNTFLNCRNLTSLTIPNSYSGISSLNATFNASGLISITLPQNLSSCNDMTNTFNNCLSLQVVNMPTNLTAVQTAANAFSNCAALRSLTFPSTMNSVISMNSTFSNCTALKNIILPTSMTALAGSGTPNGLATTFLNCVSLTEVTLPLTINGGATSMNLTSTFQGCFNLKKLVLPISSLNNLVNATNMVNNCYTLTGITNIEFFGNSGNTTTNYVNGTTFATGSREIRSLDFRCKFSKLELQGTGTGVNLSKLNTLRLRNSGTGQYAGTSPHINISFTDLSQAALVQVFNDLPTVTAKTINITSATGASSLTAGERAIATGKGWTIVG